MNVNAATTHLRDGKSSQAQFDFFGLRDRFDKVQVPPPQQP
jgi:hypothetical protein